MSNYIATDTDLTTVANAIRTKGGTNAQLSFPSGFVTAIENITTGGVTPAPEKLINFIDYDGTILYSYTASEFAQLSALPSNPTHHSNLIPQGWNRTLAQIQSHVAAFPRVPITVGQIYRTIDGKTHVHLYISPAIMAVGKSWYFIYSQTVAYGVEIDWGDGSAIEKHSTTNDAVYCTHNYGQPGHYEITMDVVDGELLLDSKSENAITGAYYAAERCWNRQFLRAIEIGDNVTSIGNYAFAYQNFLETITISPDVTSIGKEAFDECLSLRAIILPNVTSLGQYAFWSCSGAKWILMPTTMTSWSDYIFDACGGVLRGIIIPDGITQIKQYTFGECYGMSTLIIPSSVTSIANYAFYRCYSTMEYHFLSTTPPTLAHTDAFYRTTNFCKIYVPVGCGNAYKNATNWSTYASQIQEESA